MAVIVFMHAIIGFLHAEIEMLLSTRPRVQGGEALQYPDYTVPAFRPSSLGGPVLICLAR